MRNPTLLLACLLVLAACDKAAAPADPATSAAAREGARHHELKDAIEAKDYRAKAKAAGDQALDADKKHDEQLENDTGG
jgi:hypothetical protein